MSESQWARPARTCAQMGVACVVQYDAMRDWLWCIHCRDPKLTAEQLDRQGTRI